MTVREPESLVVPLEELRKVQHKQLVDPLSVEAPEALRKRTCRVQLHQPNQLVLPMDALDRAPAEWFNTGRGMRPVQGGNEVTYLIDGEPTFQAMYEAISTTLGKKSDQYYIYMANWYLDETLPLIAGKSETALTHLLKTAAENDVQIRALLWGNVSESKPVGALAIVSPYVLLPTMGTLNESACTFINGLRGGAAILDRRHLSGRAGGSHHQKLLVVNGEDGLIAFCGGVDFAPDRVERMGQGVNLTGTQPGAPWHDVHCRVRGPAALELLETFTERWTDHPETTDENWQLRGMPATGDSMPVPASRGRQLVQIGRTYGDLCRNDGELLAALLPYRYALKGEMSAWRMIKKGIRGARRFIYVEDQYLVSLECRDELRMALERGVEHITILVPHSDITYMWRNTRTRRWEFLEPLLGYTDAQGVPRVRVFSLTNPGLTDPDKGIHTYVHSKMWVFDDRYAIIGSANCNRRSYTHDSEVVAGIADEAVEWDGLHFAHRLRMALWAEHLGMQTKEGYAELIDGVASAVHWLRPPAGARIIPFDAAPDGNVFTAPWSVADPVGNTESNHDD